MSKRLKIYACSGVGASAGYDSHVVAQNIEDSGWTRNETLRKYLGTAANGGCADYFLYIFIPDSEIGHYTSTIYRKRIQQQKTYLYVRELFVSHNYGTEDEMLEILRSGIEKTYGVPVETVLSGIRNGNVEAVGLPLTSAAIAAIVTAVCGVVTAVIAGVIQYAMAVKVAKYTAPTYEEVYDSAPDGNDFFGDNKKKLGWAAAIIGGAVAIGLAIKNMRE